MYRFCGKRFGLWRTRLVLCLLLCLLFSACGTQRATPDSHEGEAQSISTLLFKQEDISEVLIKVSRSFSGDVYVTANEEEQSAIIGKLFEADIGDLVDAELTGVMGASVSFTIRTEDDERDLQIASAGDAQYIVITNKDGEKICRKGPADSFAFTDLNRLAAEVLGNENDKDYSGTVTLIESGFERAVNKGNCAYARGILDGVIAVSGTADAFADDVYDIEFEVGDVLYGIDGETGRFYRLSSGVMMYAQINDQQLTQVKTWLGVLSAAG